MSSVAVIIPAAGKSSRFGGREKKPFASLDGRAVWLRSAELFWSPRRRCQGVHRHRAGRPRRVPHAGSRHLLAFANAEVVDGGAERFESVGERPGPRPGHGRVRGGPRRRAARSTPAALIDAVFAAAAKHGRGDAGRPGRGHAQAGGPGDNRISGTVPRAGLWQAQTPQVFRRDWLVEAYAKRSEFAGSITDDAQLVEAAGHAGDRGARARR